MTENSIPPDKNSSEEEVVRIPPDFNRFVAVDIETTGLNPSEGEIIELGAVRFIDGVEEEVFHALIRPEKGYPERNRRLTGIKPEQLEAGERAHDVLENFSKFLKDDLIVSHNAPFDTGFLAYHTKKCGLEPIDNESLCTLHLAALVNPEAPTLQLAILAEGWGVTVKAPHRALQDARMAGHLALKLMAEMRTWPREFSGHLASYRGKSVDVIFDFLDHIAGDVDISGWRLDENVFSELADGSDEPSLPRITDLNIPGPEYGREDIALRDEVSDALRAGRVTILEDMRPGAGPASCVLEDSIPQDMGQVVIAIPDETTIGNYVRMADGTDGRCNGSGPFYLGKRSEYICLSRAFDTDGNPSGWLELSPFERIVFARWLAGTCTGRVARVNWWLLNNFSGLKGHMNSLCSSGLECIGASLNFDAPDFADIAADRAAKSSRVVVTQEHLCLKESTVPDSERLLGNAGTVIVEGATSLVNAARVSESSAIELDSLRRGFSVLYDQVSDSNPEFAKLITHSLGLIKELLETCRRVIKAHRESKPRESSGPIPISEESWNNEIFDELAVALEATGENLRKIVTELVNSFEMSPEIAVAMNTLSLMADTVVDFRRCSRDRATSIEGAPARNPKRVTLRISPVDVSGVIQRVIDESSNGFLAIDRNLRYLGSFGNLRSSWGIQPDVDLRERVLEDPEAALPVLFIPEDVTTPTIRSGRKYHWEKYMQRTANLLRMLADTLNGRTVAAFSAHHELRRVREILGENPPSDSIVLAQYMDGTKSSLIREYLTNQQTLLLGGRNFLDGVDLRPAGFTALVLVKLPFVSPEEPVHNTTLKMLEAQGVDGMRNYLVPIAVDASNKWIDSLNSGPIPDNSDPKTPPGAVIILDPRAAIHDWGEDFISGLNAMPVSRLSFREMISKLGEMQ